MYEWERNRIKTNKRQYYTVKPKKFELNVNFRSHNGILQVAASVIDLIRHFFPNSIDSLKPERGEVGGPRPKIICAGDQSEIEIFKAFSTIANSEHIELGANKVIIVRD